VPPVEILDPDRAVELSPELAPLRDLCAAGGWLFSVARRNGEISAIYGARICPPRYMDIVRVFGPDRVVVARAWLSGPRAGDFILNREGPPGEVLPLLLALPEPEL
jgi:hypothetical protein